MSLNNTQNNETMVEFDAIYTLEPQAILKKIVNEELRKSGSDSSRLTTQSLSIKRAIVLIIFGLITLISTVCYFFYASATNCLIAIGLPLIMSILIFKNLTLEKELLKQATNNPDADIHSMIQDIVERNQTIIMPPAMMFLITFILALAIPMAVFFQPRTFYTTYQDGYAIARYTKGITNPTEITIPDTYKDKPVIAIESGAFKDSIIKNINLPQRIEYIGGEAFLNATKLEQIIIPNRVTEIKGNTFENCTKLKSISLSEDLVSIRGSAFKKCASLSSIDLPESLTYLGAGAFSYCSMLENITIPENVTVINGETFAYCGKLEQVTLHDYITNISGESFKGCSNLTSIVLPPDITEISGNTFENCSSLTSIDIPEGVTRIGGHAFYGCSSLAEVTIPSTVREIGSSAFRCCDSLLEVAVPEEATINERAFKESPTNVERY